MFEIDITLPRDHFQLTVSEKLEPDCIWAIMGASGCGKTSLLRCLAGLESQAKGCIRFNSMVWQDSARGVYVAPEKRRVGYIFQEARLFPHLDVMDNLQFARKRATKSQQCPGFNDVVQQLGIDHLLGRSIDKLSGGEKQRVAIARTLLNAPDVLLMDEPMASLDWQAKTEILPRLRSIQQHFNIPVVMVSHSREEVARLADKVLLMEKGRVATKGTCFAVMAQSVAKDIDGRQALAVLEGNVLRHEKDYPLSELRVSGQTIVVNKVALLPGSPVRVVIPAHEVSIFLDDVAATSVQNRLKVTIETMQEQGSHHVLVYLSLGSNKLLSLITKKSMSELSLKKGQQVFAHFKASALDVY